MIIAEEGTPRADKGGWASSSENIYKMYKKYLNNAKSCQTGPECFRQDAISFLNNTRDVNYNDETTSKLILSDGVQLIFNTDPSWADCSAHGGGTVDICAWIVADLNGEKKPNKYGRDFFYFAIKEKGLYPYGCDEVEDYCQPDKSDKYGHGQGCACKVLREGAMNY